MIIQQIKELSENTLSKDNIQNAGRINVKIKKNNNDAEPFY